MLQTSLDLHGQHFQQCTFTFCFFTLFFVLTQKCSAHKTSIYSLLIGRQNCKFAKTGWMVGRFKSLKLFPSRQFFATFFLFHFAIMLLAFYILYTYYNIITNKFFYLDETAIAKAYELFPFNFQTNCLCANTCAFSVLVLTLLV